MSAADDGRMTRAAALGLKLRILCFAASPTFNSDKKWHPQADEYTCYGNYSLEDTADFTVYIPRTDPHFMTSLAVIPLQLLGYYISVARGLDVDKPRNLAKSVTVE